jgi:hypothetical protein
MSRQLCCAGMRELASENPSTHSTRLSRPAEPGVGIDPKHTWPPGSVFQYGAAKNIGLTAVVGAARIAGRKTNAARSAVGCRIAIGAALSLARFIGDHRLEADGFRLRLKAA